MASDIGFNLITCVADPENFSGVCDGYLSLLGGGAEAYLKKFDFCEPLGDRNI